MQHIIQHLFRADTLEEVPRESLEALVEEYPSFSIARYLLSSKLRTEQADHFEEETRRTNLYFTNPFWLQWLLQQTDLAPGISDGTVVEEPRHVAEEPAEAEQVAEPVEEEPVADPVEVEPVEAAEEIVVAEQHETPIGGSIVTEEAEPHREEPVVAEQAAAQSFADQASQTVQPENRVIEEPLVFESYHMIDYFASQGIKLAPDENPSDRLGKQLKSFTEWLKVMKRLPQKEAGIASDISAENKIQAIAAHSIEGREVVTETMAEVLAMQGMREKALEVYHKLSLLNPGKSGYFAEKIEQLKSN